MNVRNAKQLKLFYESALSALEFLSDYEDMEKQVKELAGQIMKLKAERKKFEEEAEQAKEKLDIVNNEILDLQAYKNEVIGSAREESDKILNDAMEKKAAVEAQTNSLRKSSTEKVAKVENNHNAFMKKAAAERKEMEEKLEELRKQIKLWKESFNG